MDHRIELASEQFNTKSESAILANVVEDLLQSEADGANETLSTPRAN
jgi:hypothetical protein